MPIVNEFADNDSDLSFLVVFQNIFDFYDFKTFKAFETFETDLRNATEESGFNLLKDIIFEAYFEEYKRFADGKDYFRTEQTIRLEIEKLFKIAEISDENFQKSLEKVRNLSEKYCIEIKQTYPHMLSTIFNSKSPFMFLNGDENEFFQNCIERFNKEFYADEFYNNLEKDSENITKELQNALKRQGYEIRAIKYEDTPNKCFMEQGFIPFLKQNPERNYEIITLNNN